MYDVDEKALAWLHQFEDIGEMYDCIEIETLSQNTHFEVKCFCYVKHGDFSGLLKEIFLECYTLEQSKKYLDQ